MKNKFKIIIGASAVSVLAGTVLADQSLNPVLDQTAPAPESSSQNRAIGLNGTCKASEVIGKTVENYQQEKLGKVNDLILDVPSGRIVQVILASGGILGIGDTLTAVPPAALHPEGGNKTLNLDASVEKFKAAPKFNPATWDTETQSNQVTEVYGYYGEHPYFIGRPEGSWQTNTDGTASYILNRTMDGTPNPDGPRSLDKVNNAEIARNENTNNAAPTQNPDGTWTRSVASNENARYSSRSGWGYLQKESKLIGAPVWNLQNETLGKVENFIVNISQGRIVAVIISSGGFLGLDGELSAIPPNALHFNGDHDGLQLDTSKERLASAPHFQKGQWPDFSQPGYDAGVYQAYRVEPYFSTNTPAQADNTAQNLRDRDHRTLTPLDQGNSQADIDTTAQIRQAIIAVEGLSIDAKNVKIITLNGHVTLRGPVNSEDEKHQIGDIAARIAQSNNVDNQLQVTPGTTSSNN